MVSKSKLFAKLDSLEEELQERLVPHLEKAAAGENDLVFCVEGYHSIQRFKPYSDETTTELVNIGSQILVLKEKLGEPSKGAIAERICWYCREWASHHEHNRKTAQALAMQFLDEIQ